MEAEILKTASGGCDQVFSIGTGYDHRSHAAFTEENVAVGLRLASERSKNAENQLVSVTVPGVSVSTYLYDYIGRRVRKSVDLVSGTDHVVTWVYSGWNKLQETKTVGSTVTTKNFVWGLDLSQSFEGAGGIGGLLAVVDGSGTANLFAYDGNGNVSELIDSGTGTTAAHYEYDAFGNTVNPLVGAALENNYRFSTKYLDQESGLYYYGYRYYDAQMGRWVNRDPIAETGGLNLYGFVRNRPVATADFLGLADYRLEGTLGADASRFPSVPSTDPSIPTDETEGNWRSMSATYTDNVMREIFLRALGDAASSTHPDAAAHMRHYLGNSGAPYTIRFENLLAETKDGPRALGKEIRLAKAFAETLPDGKHHIASSSPTSGYITESDSSNWYFATAGHWVWGKAQVERCGDSFRMYYEHKFYDRYNWDQNKFVNILGVEIEDDLLGHLHRVGVAQQYDLVGSVRRTMEWKRGDAVRQVRSGWLPY